MPLVDRTRDAPVAYRDPETDPTCPLCGRDSREGRHGVTGPEGSRVCSTAAPWSPKRRGTPKSGVARLREKWAKEHPGVWR